MHVSILLNTGGVWQTSDNDGNKSTKPNQTRWSSNKFWSISTIKTLFFLSPSLDCHLCTSYFIFFFLNLHRLILIIKQIWNYIQQEFIQNSSLQKYLDSLGQDSSSDRSFLPWKWMIRTDRLHPDWEIHTNPPKAMQLISNTFLKNFPLFSYASHWELCVAQGRNGSHHLTQRTSAPQRLYG